MEKNQIMSRQNISSGTSWEPIVGYSRAVRVGPHVHVSGTTATGPEGLVGVGDVYLQTVQTLKECGSRPCRSRGENSTMWYVHESMCWTFPAGKMWPAHIGSFFGDIRPATSMVEVSRLISPEMLVEIEVDAFIDG